MKPAWGLRCTDQLATVLPWPAPTNNRTMIEHGPASENEIVLAFLRAEINSSQRKDEYTVRLRAWGLDQATLIDHPNLNDENTNGARRYLIGDVRGFGRGLYLFQGFPTDTAWRRVRVERPDFHLLKCISGDEHWDTVTNGTRLIQEAGRNYAAHHVIGPIVHGIMQEVLGGSELPPLIMVKVDNELVLVEGTKRATAYAALGDRPFDAFIGTSQSMGNWTRGRD
jgi:hypothetical protein